jgi:hypothetical protein
MATPTPRAQMNSPLVASYVPGRTLLSMLLCEALLRTGDGDQPLPVAVARPGAVQGVRPCSRLRRQYAAVRPGRSRPGNGNALARCLREQGSAVAFGGFVTDPGCPVHREKPPGCLPAAPDQARSDSGRAHSARLRPGGAARGGPFAVWGVRTVPPAGAAGQVHRRKPRSRARSRPSPRVPSMLGGHRAAPVAAACPCSGEAVGQQTHAAATPGMTAGSRWR